MPPRPRGRLVRPSTLVVSAVTLVVGWVFAAVLVALADDLPDDWFGESYLPAAAVLALVVAPIGLLVAWGELDLSVFGVLTAGASVYFELESDTIVLGILLAALLGLGLGAAMGTLRWLTRAPSALLTLGASTVVTMVTFKLTRDSSGPDDLARIDGAAVPLTLAVVVTALAAVVGGLRQVLDRNGEASPEHPGPDVIIGYALSGLGAATAGALAAGLEGEGLGPGAPGQIGPAAGLGLVVAGLAIGGVVRGAGLFAPVSAALGAFAAALLRDGALLSEWEPLDAELLIGSAAVVGLGLAYGLHRLLGGLDRPRPPALAAPWSAPPGQPVQQAPPGQPVSPIPPAPPAPPAPPGSEPSPSPPQPPPAPPAPPEAPPRPPPPS